jgi:hypothetical protein
MRLRDLRHGAAFLQVGADVHPRMAQQLLRHTSSKTTTEIDGHLSAAQEREAAEVLQATPAPTYDLRRLRRKGLIRRLPGRQRYLLTPLGPRIAVLFIKTDGRVLTPGLVALDPALPPEFAARRQLALAWRRLNQALDDYVSKEMIAP